MSSEIRITYIYQASAKMPNYQLGFTLRVLQPKPKARQIEQNTYTGHISGAFEEHAPWLPLSVDLTISSITLSLL
jgi:hypothetical protein